MARCGDCNKFVSTDPEITGSEAEETDGEVRATADVSLNCSDCGGEVQTGSFEMVEELEEFAAEEHKDHEIEVEITSEDASQVDLPKRRTGINVGLEVKVTCSCGKEWELLLNETKDKSEFEDS